jgi:formate dehydrogenase major subunit
MSVSVPGMEDAGCLMIFGYNPNASHPIVARRVIKAKEKGAKIIVADPRFIETARIADIYMPINNGCNVAFLNTFANVIVNEGLHDRKFIDEHTTGFDEWWKVIETYTPERTKSITGIEPEMMLRAARMYAKAEPSSILCWGMGVTQHKQNVETVHTLAAIACITHQIGKPNSGLAPVRGQNNVQGACDTGALPNVFPGYQSVVDPAAREKFAKAWGVPVERLSDHEGYKVSNIGHLIEEGKVHAFYNFGEDPLQTEPDTKRLAQQLAGLEIFVCQDIFMTQTTAVADVVLPATSWGEHEGVFTACDRTFQRFEAALPPKGECRHDWDIIADLSTRMGHPINYKNTKEIWDNELRALWPAVYGATYERMEGVGHAQWPIPALDHPGTPDLFLGGQFSTPDKKARLIAHEYERPTEMPDAEYPLILCTVREVGHYSCRSMTGNCSTLSLLAEEPGFVHINPADAEARGIKQDDMVWVFSRRGKIITRAEVDDRINKGTVYMTYQWWIGKCNDLTIHAVDGRSSTPEDKYSACQVELVDDQLWAEQHAHEIYMNMKARMSMEAAPQAAKPDMSQYRSEVA